MDSNDASKNRNDANENVQKFDFIPSKEVKEMKKLGMTDLDLFSRFSVPSRSKKGQKPLHRYNTKTLGWDPKTLWIALTLRQVSCMHENDKWTILKVEKIENTSDANEENENNEDGTQRRRAKKGFHEETLLDVAVVRCVL